MEVVAGLYCFTLPKSFFPNYEKHGITDPETNLFDFEYEVKIISDSRITNLSMPLYAAITERDDTDTCITVKST